MSANKITEIAVSVENGKTFVTVERASGGGSDYRLTSRRQCERIMTVLETAPVVGIALVPGGITMFYEPSE